MFYFGAVQCRSVHTAVGALDGECEDYNGLPRERQLARPRDTFITPPSIVALI